MKVLTRSPALDSRVTCEKPKQLEVIFSERKSRKGRESSGAGDGGANSVLRVRLPLLPPSCATQALPPGTAVRKGIGCRSVLSLADPDRASDPGASSGTCSFHRCL